MSKKTHMLDELFDMVEKRKDLDPTKSYIAKLHRKGVHRIAKKVGEEAVEVALDAVCGDRKGTIDESADLLIHLLVLWSSMGIHPDEVMEELMSRRKQSGLEEKASRTND